MDISFYTNLLNPAGKPDNFVGAYLVSEWYKRNFYIYSLIQKLTKPSDKKIMILFGASHVTLFKQFMDSDNRFNVVELKDLLK